MNRKISFRKIFALFLTAILCFNTSNITAFAQTHNLSENISYEMRGNDVIESMEFTDIDGAKVYMERVIHMDGTAEFTTTKNGKTDVVHLTNHDYNVFYNLANFGSDEVAENLHNTLLSRSGDLTGSQYKHIFIASNSYTFNNTQVQQIAALGVSEAAGLLISVFGLPGGTAVKIGGIIYAVIAALSPYKVVVNQDLYEVHFSYDNVYYTHCYHEVIKSYDTGNHLIETRTEYYQVVGG